MTRPVEEHRARVREARRLAADRYRYAVARQLQALSAAVADGEAPEWLTRQIGESVATMSGLVAGVKRRKDAQT